MASSAVLNIIISTYMLIHDDEKPQRNAKDAYLCATPLILAECAVTEKNQVAAFPLPGRRHVQFQGRAFNRPDPRNYASIVVSEYVWEGGVRISLARIRLRCIVRVGCGGEFEIRAARRKP